MHEATRQRRDYGREERAALFALALQFEQESTVALRQTLLSSARVVRATAASTP